MIATSDQNAIIGLEEIIENKQSRSNSAKVLSETAFILFISLKNFKDRILN